MRVRGRSQLGLAAASRACVSGAGDADGHGVPCPYG
jgi:hypothetical protein